MRRSNIYYAIGLIATIATTVHTVKDGLTALGIIIAVIFLTLALHTHIDKN